MNDFSPSKTRQTRYRSQTGARPGLQTQLILVLLLVSVTGLVVVGLVASRTIETQFKKIIAKNAQNIALALSENPEIQKALAKGADQGIIQEIAEKTRRKTGVKSIVVYGNDGTIYSHPITYRLGETIVDEESKTVPVSGICGARQMEGAHPNQTGFQAMRLEILAFIVPYAFCYDPGLILNAGLWGNLAAIAGGVSPIGETIKGSRLAKQGSAFFDGAWSFICYLLFTSSGTGLRSFRPDAEDFTPLRLRCIGVQPGRRVSAMFPAKGCNRPRCRRNSCSLQGRGFGLRCWGQRSYLFSPVWPECKRRVLPRCSSACRGSPVPWPRFR